MAPSVQEEDAGSRHWLGAERCAGGRPTNLDQPCQPGCEPQELARSRTAAAATGRTCLTSRCSSSPVISLLLLPSSAVTSGLQEKKVLPTKTVRSQEVQEEARHHLQDARVPAGGMEGASASPHAHLQPSHRWEENRKKIPYHPGYLTQEWTRRWCLSSAPSSGACSPQPTRTRRRTELRTSPLSLAGETRWGREDKRCSLTQVGKQRKTGGCLQKRLHPHHPSPLRLPHSISLSVSSCLDLLSIFHSQKSAFSISLLRPKSIRIWIWKQDLIWRTKVCTNLCFPSRNENSN